MPFGFIAINSPPSPSKKTMLNLDKLVQMEQADAKGRDTTAKSVSSKPNLPLTELRPVYARGDGA